MNALRQREPRLVLPALTRTAQGEDCTLQVPDVCHGIISDPTVVWCHFNWLEDGKGFGLKVHDCYGCFACQRCHDWLDRTRDPGRRELAVRGMMRTYYLLFLHGKLKVKS